MTTTIKISANSSDVRIAYVNGRAVSTIVKLENGHYRVVKLYDQYVKDCDTYSEARQEAIHAAPLRPSNVVKMQRKAS
jgi:hypothetical protein